MARPTKLTPEAHATIIKAITAGGTRTDAAAAAGVVYTTFLDWLKAGEKAKSGKFYEFYNAVNKAEADVRLSLANAFAMAGKNDWRAAEAYLKRRDPPNWGDKIQISKLTDDELLRLLGIIESRESGGAETRADATGEGASGDAHTQFSLDSPARPPD